MLLAPHLETAWLDRLDAVIAGLDEAGPSSPRPAEVDTAPFDAWLVHTRRDALG